MALAQHADVIRRVDVGKPVTPSAWAWLQWTDPASVANNATMMPETVDDMSCFGLNVTRSIDVSYYVFFGTSLLCLLVGIVGNLLSIIVFSSAPMRGTSSNVYLLAIAVSDCTYLISLALAKCLTMVKCLLFPDAHAIDIYNGHTNACRLLQFTLDVFSDYSTSLILLVTIERFIACYFPVRYRHLCTTQRARTCCLGLLLAIAVPVGVYHFPLVDIDERYNVCFVVRSAEHLFGIFYMIESTVFRIVPVFLIVALNLFIVLKLTRMSHIQRRLSNGNGLLPSSSNGAGGGGGGGGGNGAGGGGGGGGEGPRRFSVSAAAFYREDRNRQITVMLLFMSTAYVIFLLPVLVHFLIFYLQVNKMIDVDPYAMLIAQNYTRALYVIGCASDVFFYAICSSSFRAQLLVALACRRPLLPTMHDDVVAMTPIATALTPAVSHNGGLCHQQMRSSASGHLLPPDTAHALNTNRRRGSSPNQALLSPDWVQRNREHL